MDSFESLEHHGLRSRCFVVASDVLPSDVVYNTGTRALCELRGVDLRPYPPQLIAGAVELT